MGNLVIKGDASIQPPIFHFLFEEMIITHNLSTFTRSALHREIVLSAQLEAEGYSDLLKYVNLSKQHAGFKFENVMTFIIRRINSNVAIDVIHENITEHISVKLNDFTKAIVCARDGILSQPVIRRTCDAGSLLLAAIRRQ